MLNFFSLLRQTFLKKINKNFYSQFGEDKILFEILKKNYNDGFYVDVGCFHPKKYSNTHLLFKRGWKGINIDLEQNKIKVFNLARPSDHNVVAAVSNISKSVKVYKMSNYSVCTTTNINSIKNKNEIIETFNLKTKTLNEIIDKSPFKGRSIDLLNIDTEGNDFSVLTSLDINKYTPNIIIVESHLKSIVEIINSNIYQYLTKKKYNLRSWNFYSLIFISDSSKITRDR